MLFLEKYMPHALQDCKKDEQLALDQGDKSIATFESKFHALYGYATNLLTIEEERIFLFIQSFNYDLQVLSIPMNSIGKGFNEFFDYVKSHYIGIFSGFYSMARVSRPIRSA